MSSRISASCGSTAARERKSASVARSSRANEAVSRVAATSSRSANPNANNANPWPRSAGGSSANWAFTADANVPLMGEPPPSQPVGRAGPDAGTLVSSNGHPCGSPRRPTRKPGTSGSSVTPPRPHGAGERYSRRRGLTWGPSAKKLPPAPRHRAVAASTVDNPDRRCRGPISSSTWLRDAPPKARSPGWRSDPRCGGIGSSGRPLTCRARTARCSTRCCLRHQAADPFTESNWRTRNSMSAAVGSRTRRWGTGGRKTDPLYRARRC
ncbi:hypothetical protein BH24ACT7_BH24ACT7_24170 [soil metagenome]